jgi:uncharacterized protein HemY
MRRLLCLGAVIVGAFFVCATTAAPAPMTVGAVWSYALDGSPDAAIAQLEPYVQTHPDDTAAARALGDLYFRTGNLDHAETIWEADTKRHPDDHATHERLGGHRFAATGARQSERPRGLAALRHRVAEPASRR